MLSNVTPLPRRPRPVAIPPIPSTTQPSDTSLDLSFYRYAYVLLNVKHICPRMYHAIFLPSRQLQNTTRAQPASELGGNKKTNRCARIYIADLDGEILCSTIRPRVMGAGWTYEYSSKHKHGEMRT